MTPLRTLLLSLALCVAACDRQSPPQEAQSESTPAAPQATQPPAVSSSAPAETEATAEAETSAPVIAEVTVEQRVNLDAADAVNRATKRQVLERIDVMPKLSDEEKDKLYVQVERARGMGKVINIPFAFGEKKLSAKSVAALRQALAEPQVARFADDPTVVFVILGFADKKGDPAKNQAISLHRAEAVADVLKQDLGVMNVIHAVGMGGSEMFDAKNLEKNRLVEVWAVLP